MSEDQIFLWDTLRTIGSGFGFTEGPLWHPDGFLLFQDLPSATTHAWSPEGSTTTVRTQTGSSNGQTFNSRGEIVFCEGASTEHAGKRRIGRIEAGGVVATVADRCQGRRLNAPNDVTARSDGVLFFTNPVHIIPADQLDIPYSSVYRIDTDGEVRETSVRMPLPNGIALSPDEQTLYVSNTRPEPSVMWYPLDTEANPGPGRTVIDLPPAPEGRWHNPMVPDGIKVDLLGRIYVSAPGGVWVMTPDGTVLTVLRTPQWVTNLAFGDEDGRTLFLTCRDVVCSVRTTVPGKTPTGATSAIPFTSLFPTGDMGSRRAVRSRQPHDRDVGDGE